MAQHAGPRREPNGTWSFVVDLPSTSGRRRQVRRRGFRTRADAQAALDELRVAARGGVVPTPTKHTLAQFLIEDWLPAVRVTVEPLMWASYNRYLRLHVVPRIGHLPLVRLDAGVLNRFYADLLETGWRDGRPGGLSPRTVRYIHTILGRALREAVAWGRLSRNVVTAGAAAERTSS